jgi:hypothetical protein
MYQNLRQEALEALRNTLPDPLYGQAAAALSPVLDDYAGRMALAIRWTSEDVADRARERGTDLTEEEAQEVLATAIGRHDASVGINWDVLDAHIDGLVADRKEETP